MKDSLCLPGQSEYVCLLQYGDGLTIARRFDVGFPSLFVAVLQNKRLFNQAQFTFQPFLPVGMRNLVLLALPSDKELYSRDISCFLIF